MPPLKYCRCWFRILGFIVFAGLGIQMPFRSAQATQPDSVYPETSLVPAQSERDRRAEIRRTLDQRPQRGGGKVEDGRNRLSDEERRSLRKDIGDAGRDVYDKNKSRRKNGSTRRNGPQ